MIMENYNCPICHRNRKKVFSAKVLFRYHIDYFFCDDCGFLQTETPFWLEEAYSPSSLNLDTGAVSRNLSIAKMLSCLLYTCFPLEGRFVDIGGGYGLLTRLMRDIGFDFYWFDPYCENLFAKGFEAGAEITPLDAITCFEVMEHIYNPLYFMEKNFEQYKTNSFLCSTVTFEGGPPPKHWWYYSFDTGQHISFYQRRTLQRLAQYFGKSLYTVNDNVHIITGKSINSIWLKICSNSLIINILSFLIKMIMQSKTAQDRLNMSNNYNAIHNKKGRT